MYILYRVFAPSPGEAAKGTQTVCVIVGIVRCQTMGGPVTVHSCTLEYGKSVTSVPYGLTVHRVGVREYGKCQVGNLRGKLP